MKRAIVTAWHKYTPFGGEFYEPMLDFYIKQMKKWEQEYDHIYFVDSTWNINPEKIKDLKATILKVNSSLRYYDVYKSILPEIKESLVLFTDNDMVIYKPNVIELTFNKLEDKYDVVSIYDTIGKTFPQLNGKSKFCPYWFATGTAMLSDFIKYDWGSNMPEYETLGKLTEMMLKEEIIPYEWKEDKSSLYYDGTEGYSDNSGKGKDLGYYHIRAGSSPAVLLAWKNSPDHKHTYKEYLKNQPKQEYIRQLAWYQYMGGDINEMINIVEDSGIKNSESLWMQYHEDFMDYHNLPF